MLGSMSTVNFTAIRPIKKAISHKILFTKKIN